MKGRTIKLQWDERVINGGDVLTFLFGERRQTVSAARLLIRRMKESRHMAMTKRELRFFAKELEGGRDGVKYSYHNFYTKLLRKLLDMGFIERDVLIWDEKRKKTMAVYQLKLQAIPERPPQGGFVKHAWHIAKGWNELLKG